MAGWMNGAVGAIFGTAGLLVVLGSTGAEALPTRAPALCAPSAPGCTLTAARPDLSACRVAARPVAKRTARNLLVPIKQRPPFLAEPRPVPSRYVSFLVLGVGY